MNVPYRPIPYLHDQKYVYPFPIPISDKTQSGWRWPLIGLHLKCVLILTDACFKITGVIYIYGTEGFKADNFDHSVRAYSGKGNRKTYINRFSIYSGPEKGPVRNIKSYYLHSTLVDSLPLNALRLCNDFPIS